MLRNPDRSQDKKEIFINALQKFIEEARGRSNLNLASVYTKALNAIRGCNVPLYCGADATKLGGIGPVIASRLDKFAEENANASQSTNNRNGNGSANSSNSSPASNSNTAVPLNLQLRRSVALTKHFLSLADTVDLFDIFWQNGYYNFQVLTNLEMADLDSMSIQTPGIRKSLILASKLLKENPDELFKVLLSEESSNITSSGTCNDNSTQTAGIDDINNSNTDIDLNSSSYVF